MRKVQAQGTYTSKKSNAEVSYDFEYAVLEGIEDISAAGLADFHDSFNLFCDFFRRSAPEHFNGIEVAADGKLAFRRRANSSNVRRRTDAFKT